MLLRNPSENQLQNSAIAFFPDAFKSDPQVRTCIRDITMFPRTSLPLCVHCYAILGQSGSGRAVSSYHYLGFWKKLDSERRSIGRPIRNCPPDAEVRSLTHLETVGNTEIQICKGRAMIIGEHQAPRKEVPSSGIDDPVMVEHIFC
jgi:hypothetical protein